MLPGAAQPGGARTPRCSRKTRFPRAPAAGLRAAPAVCGLPLLVALPPASAEDDMPVPALFVGLYNIIY
jgi:hypothetical protein